MMHTLNDIYLSTLTKKYMVTKLELGDFKFSAYYFSDKTMKSICIWLCNCFDSTIDMRYVLNKISEYDHTTNEGKSYLCVMPVANPEVELCTHCNGKSFVHFIFYNMQKQKVVCDKAIYYAGSRKIKGLMDVFVDCFRSVVGNRTGDGDVT